MATANKKTSHRAEKLAAKMAARDAMLSEPTRRGLRQMLGEFSVGAKFVLCSMVAGVLSSVGYVIAELVGCDTKDAQMVAGVILFPSWIVAAWVTWRLTGDSEYDPNT